MCFLAIRNLSILAEFILPIFYIMRPYFLSRKLIDFDRWSIIVMMNRFGFNKSIEEINIIKAISDNTNNRRYSTYKGTLILLPTQKEIDKIFNQLSNFDLNLSHYENTQNLQRIGIKIIDLKGNEIPESPFKSQL